MFESLKYFIKKTAVLENPPLIPCPVKTTETMPIISSSDIYQSRPPQRAIPPRRYGKRAAK